MRKKPGVTQWKSLPSRPDGSKLDRASIRQLHWVGVSRALKLAMTAHDSSFISGIL